MNNEDRRLIVETLAEMKELKGELNEFKVHVMGRIQRLEERDKEQARNAFAVISLLVSGAALAVNFFINVFRNR